MKHIRKFNENKSHVKKEDIIRFLSEIRECCLDFEDDGLISYSVFHKNETINGYWATFNPINNNFDTWVEIIYHGLQRIQNSDFGIVLSLKIPEVKNDKCLLGHDGISRLEDIINISRRLENLDFEVEMDINYKHHEYKPVNLFVMYPDF